MTGYLPPLEQLAIDIAELLDRFETRTVYERDRSRTSRVHRTCTGGLLREVTPGRVTLTRAGDNGGSHAYGTRPPGRFDLIALPLVVTAEGNALRRELDPRCRLLCDAESVLRDLAHRAACDLTVAPQVARVVAGWLGTAKVALGYAEPPVTTPLRCLHCGMRLVAPASETGGRYLLCPDRGCVDGEGRRHRWSEYDVPLLVRGQRDELEAG